MVRDALEPEEHRKFIREIMPILEQHAEAAVPLDADRRGTPRAHLVKNKQRELLEAVMREL